MTRRILTAALAVGLLASAAVAGDLSLLKVFPNPARVNRGDHQMTFENISGGDIKIFNAAGRLVFEKTIDPAVTSFIWDLKNNDGHDVASGIYLFFLQSDGDSRTGKVGIIR